YMAHGTQIIVFKRLHFLHNTEEVVGGGEVPVVELEEEILFVRVLVEVVYPVSIKEGAAAVDAVHLVVLAEEEVGEVGAVLAGDAGDESCFHEKTITDTLQSASLMLCINIAGY